MSPSGSGRWADPHWVVDAHDLVKVLDGLDMTLPVDVFGFVDSGLLFTLLLWLGPELLAGHTSHNQADPGLLYFLAQELHQLVHVGMRRQLCIETGIVSLHGVVGQYVGRPNVPPLLTHGRIYPHTFNISDKSTKGQIHIMWKDFPSKWV